jgi:hypothetical protein
MSPSCLYYTLLHLAKTLLPFLLYALFPTIVAASLCSLHANRRLLLPRAYFAAIAVLDFWPLDQIGLCRGSASHEEPKGQGPEDGMTFAIARDHQL